jgi:hypothetical protein
MKVSRKRLVALLACAIAVACVGAIGGKLVWPPADGPIRHADGSGPLASTDTPGAAWSGGINPTVTPIETVGIRVCREHAGDMSILEYVKGTQPSGAAFDSLVRSTGSFCCRTPFIRSSAKVAFRPLTLRRRCLTLGGGDRNRDMRRERVRRDSYGLRIRVIERRRFSRDRYRLPHRHPGVHPHIGVRCDVLRPAASAYIC